MKSELHFFSELAYVIPEIQDYYNLVKKSILQIPKSHCFSGKPISIRGLKIRRGENYISLYIGSYKTIEEVFKRVIKIFHHHNF